VDVGEPPRVTTVTAKANPASPIATVATGNQLRLRHATAAHTITATAAAETGLPTMLSVRITVVSKGSRWAANHATMGRSIMAIPSYSRTLSDT
jgi:hypothetical protein